MTFKPGSEDATHYDIKSWLEWVVPGIEVLHVPNSFFAGKGDPNDVDAQGKPKRTVEKRHVARLKALGMRPGALDLLCMVPGKPPVFWIEVKVGKRGLDPDQVEFGRRLDRLGIPWALCRSIDDAAKFLDTIDVRTRIAA